MADDRPDPDLDHDHDRDRDHHDKPVTAIATAIPSHGISINLPSPADERAHHFRQPVRHVYVSSPRG
jgi:hypothetical protein